MNKTKKAFNWTRASLLLALSGCDFTEPEHTGCRTNCCGKSTLMLRPDCLNTAEPGDYLLTVEEISFRGSDTQVTFRASDGTLWEKAFHGGVPWQVGDTLSVRLDLTEPVLFKRS